MWISSQEELRTLDDNVCLLKERFKIMSLHILFWFSSAPKQKFETKHWGENGSIQLKELFSTRATQRTQKLQQKAELLYQYEKEYVFTMKYPNQIILK